MLAAWSAGDGDAVAAYFAPDGVWEDVTMPFRHEGRAPIVDMWSRVPTRRRCGVGEAGQADRAG
jgi:ketosteroid isomerase-like protein